MEEFFRDVREGAAKFNRRHAPAPYHDPESIRPSKKSELGEFGNKLDKERLSDRLYYLRQSEEWDRLKTPFFIEEWNGEKMVSDGKDDPFYWEDEIKYETHRDGQRLRFRRPGDDSQFDFRLAALEGRPTSHQVAVFFYRKDAAKLFTVIDPNGETSVQGYRDYTTWDFVTALGQALSDDWKYENMRFPDIQSCEDSSMIEGGACTLWATATVELVSRFGFEGARKAIENIEDRSKVLKWAGGVSRIIVTDVASSFILDYAGYLNEKFREMKGLEYYEPDEIDREREEYKLAWGVRNVLRKLKERMDSLTYEDAKELSKKETMGPKTVKVENESYSVPTLPRGYWAPDYDTGIGGMTRLGLKIVMPYSLHRVFYYDKDGSKIPGSTYKIHSEYTWEEMREMKKTIWKKRPFLYFYYGPFTLNGRVLPKERSYGPEYPYFLALHNKFYRGDKSWMESIPPEDQTPGPSVFYNLAERLYEMLMREKSESVCLSNYGVEYQSYAWESVITDIEFIIDEIDAWKAAREKELEKQSLWFFRSLDEDSDEYMPRMAVGIDGYAF